MDVQNNEDLYNYFLEQMVSLRSRIDDIAQAISMIAESPIQKTEEDHLDIPAFLRRQADDPTPADEKMETDDFSEASPLMNRISVIEHRLGVVQESYLDLRDIKEDMVSLTGKVEGTCQAVAQLTQLTRGEDQLLDKADTLGGPALHTTNHPRLRPEPIEMENSNQGGQYEKVEDRGPWKHRSSGMKCGTCMWWVAKEAHEVKTMRPETVIGRCRRHSPTMSGYPACYLTDWCGDHKLDENKL